MINCKQCGKSTKNKMYCSRICSNTMNSKVPKRKLSKKCKTCSKNIRSNVTYCKKCWAEFYKLKDITLKEAIYSNLHKSSAFGLIRTRARKIAKDNNMSSCEHCGYNKHVEIAHIKPISSFSTDTLVSVINSKSNLKALCPNCHWEFDHNVS